jgi:hypothetical protein
MHFHAHGRDGARSPQVIEGKKVRKGLATPEAVPVSKFWTRRPNNEPLGSYA